MGPRCFPNTRARRTNSAMCVRTSSVSTSALSCVTSLLIFRQYRKQLPRLPPPPPSRLATLAHDSKVSAEGREWYVSVCSRAPNFAAYTPNRRFRSRAAVGPGFGVPFRLLVPMCTRAPAGPSSAVTRAGFFANTVPHPRAARAAPWGLSTTSHPATAAPSAGSTSVCFAAASVARTDANVPARAAAPKHRAGGAGATRAAAAAASVSSPPAAAAAAAAAAVTAVVVAWEGAWVSRSTSAASSSASVSPPRPPSRTHVARRSSCSLSDRASSSPSALHTPKRRNAVRFALGSDDAVSFRAAVEVAVAVLLPPPPPPCLGGVHAL
eukprot:Rhum_TRINITY_DN9847_c0_g1::Rhum_TRINITY_DN9847_c0_g1_i1::g.35389::m.35389